MSNCVNNYVPDFVPQDLSWYERNGLMTWYEQIKCENFVCNIDKHFKEVNVINLDIIHREARGENVPDDLFRYY